MTLEAAQDIWQKMDAGVKAGAALAIDEHRRMGRSIVVWQDGKVVTIPPEEIPVIAQLSGVPISQSQRD